MSKAPANKGASVGSSASLAMPSVEDLIGNPGQPGSQGSGAMAAGPASPAHLLTPGLSGTVPGTPLASGAGAVSAGKPTFARPSAGTASAAPRVSVPVAQQSLQRVQNAASAAGARALGSSVAGASVMGASVRGSSVAGPSVAGSSVAAGAMKANPSRERDLDRQLRQSAVRGWGYLFRRAFAYVLDTAINVGLCAAALSFGLIRQGIQPDALIGPGMAVLFTLFLLAFNWALITAQEIAFSTSLGKRIFGLSLSGAATTLLLRSFLFVVGSLFFGIGLIWAMFDSERRCWHDIAVDLQPGEFTKL